MIELVHPFMCSFHGPLQSIAESFFSKAYLQGMPGSFDGGEMLKLSMRMKNGSLEIKAR